MVTTPTQLTLAGDTVTVCTRCGLPLSEGTYARYSGDLCRPCRTEDEEPRTCDTCDTEMLEGDLYEESYFFDPWADEESDTGMAYCQKCIDSGGFDEGTFWCDGCSRQISDSNGRMYYYRILNECEQVCLRCIETDLLEGGIAALNDEDILDSVIRDGKPWGMFFNRGQLEAAGWEVVPDWDNTRFDESFAEDLANTCRALYEADKPFIIEYESLSISGDEGYITVRTKDVA